LSEAISAAAANEVPKVRDAVTALIAEVRPEGRDPSSSIVAVRRSARVASRLRAMRELAVVGTAEATAALAEAVVSDPSPEARVLAAAFLSNCKERWLSMPALARPLMDPAPEVAIEASRAMAESYGGDKRERRNSDLPPDSKNSLRRTTGRMQRQATLAG
jgi:hypothetical protein